MRTCPSTSRPRRRNGRAVERAPGLLPGPLGVFPPPTMSLSPAIPDSTAAGRLLIVDGHAYAYRAFYAIRSLSSPSGRPTNAIYGFVKMLAKMRAALEPTHLAVIWDGGLAAERMELLPEYKAQRPPMPDDLEAQIEEIKEY